MPNQAELDAAYAELWDTHEAISALVKNIKVTADSEDRRSMNTELRMLDLQGVKILERIDTIYDNG